jgi:putative endonuclease
MEGPGVRRPGLRVPARQARGLIARRSGRRAEWLAALWLMAKGYRILGLRLVTPYGEIDLLAQRGGVLAVVEVKHRRTLEEALVAVGAVQRARLLRAGQNLAARAREPQTVSVRLDLIALAPGRRPRHIAGAWSQDG